MLLYNITLSKMLLYCKPVHQFHKTCEMKSSLVLFLFQSYQTKMIYQLSIDEFILKLPDCCQQLKAIFFFITTRDSTPLMTSFERVLYHISKIFIKKKTNKKSQLHLLAKGSNSLFSEYQECLK